MQIHRTHYDTAKVNYGVVPNRIPQPRSIGTWSGHNSVARYVEAARSSATRRAYAHDIARFKSAGAVSRVPGTMSRDIWRSLHQPLQSPPCAVD